MNAGVYTRPYLAVALLGLTRRAEISVMWLVGSDWIDDD
jgi:hypothetical protein